MLSTFQIYFYFCLQAEEASCSISSVGTILPNQAGPCVMTDITESSDFRQEKKVIETAKIINKTMFSLVILRPFI